MAKIPECWVNLYVHPTTGRMWREVFDTKEEAVARIKDYPASCALETAIPMCRVNALAGRDPAKLEALVEAAGPIRDWVLQMRDDVDGATVLKIDAFTDALAAFEGVEK